jgi:hypothetical protein
MSFGVTVILYFLKILSGSRNYCGKSDFKLLKFSYIYKLWKNLQNTQLNRDINVYIIILLCL